MRKLISLAFLVSTLFIMSCGGDESDPKVISNTNHLAGKKGQSKSWIMTGFTIKDGGSTDDIFAILDACITDNIFTFTNSDEQEFEQTEGSSKCVVTDANVVESGTWYLTSNGLFVKILVFSEDVNTDNAALFAYFSSIAFSITELSSSTLVIEYDDGGVIYTITFEAA